jgi:hypothetical protein
MAGMDTKATAYVDAGLKRAGAAFLLARTMNAIISVFQESELQLEPGGVGVSFALGQALDPINDMVERFSWVMLVSVTSLGVQKVLIEIGPWVSISLVLSLGLLFLLAGLWIGNHVSFNFRRVGGTLVLLAVLIRFAVPVMTFLNHQAYEAVLERKYIESTGQIEENVEQFKKYNHEDIAGAQKSEIDQVDQQGEGWFSKSKAFVSQAIAQGKNIVDLKGTFDSIKKIASGTFDHIVNLIVVFVMNTILLPLVFMWGFLKLARLLIGQGFLADTEKYFINKVEANNKLEK